MKPFSEMAYHPTSEKLAQILCAKTHSNEAHFFRIQVAYFFSMAASMMGTKVRTHDQGDLPVNLYAINLAPSGYGKGKSVNIIEDEVINGFREEFLERTFPLMAQDSLTKLADKTAARTGNEPVDELTRLEGEFANQGPLLFSFDSGTEPALKQMRHKLLMANGGALNLQIDELGLNLLESKDLLKAYLELYDKGLIKTKLVKFTADNKRAKELKGATPANLLLFGTPSKLFDSSKTEEEFMAMLDTGYARRCFFGYVATGSKHIQMTADELYAQATDTGSSQYLIDLSDQFTSLADPVNQNRSLIMSTDVAKQVFEYQIICQERASKLKEHQEIQRAELTHRHFKTLKLAGAYAFVDGSGSITEEHLHAAIRIAEDSGEALTHAVHREPTYAKLARYVADAGRDVTQHDLVEALPFYRGSASVKSDLMTLATAWGYKNNIILKKAFQDGVEFLRGESLTPTNMDEMLLSYSDDITHGYENVVCPFDRLQELFETDGMHWISHHLSGGYRQASDVLTGFNMIVVDVDGELPLTQARTLLSDITYVLYTTKSHTAKENRYRLVIPTNYVLHFEEEEYKEFMRSVFEWLPWDVKDVATGHRVKKWATARNSQIEVNNAEVFDVLPFIPKTSKDEQRREHNKSLHSLDSLERWFISNTGDGNRNNQLLRFAYSLVDAGYDTLSIQSKVFDLNDKMADKLDQSEIVSTIMTSVQKRIAQQTP